MRATQWSLEPVCYSSFLVVVDKKKAIMTTQAAERKLVKSGRHMKPKSISLTLVYARTSAFFGSLLSNLYSWTLSHNHRDSAVR